MLKRNIPVYQPSLVGNEKKYVNECLDTTWISSKGKFVSQFENSFSDYLKVSGATSVSNGTVALHLALEALGIGRGDEVIVPTLTYIASVNAIAMVGAVPVFIDSDEGSWNIDYKQIAEKITSKTKAVMVVHLYGLPCEMDAIVDICRANNLYLIEDAAEAFGSKYNDRYVGSFGDISTFSFFGNKTLTTGEGGMVVSNDAGLIERAAYLKSQAVSNIREYWHDEIGYNYRMTNICAAIGLAQLEKADTVILKKRELAIWYKAELSELPILFQEDKKDIFNSFWMVSILLENEEVRDRVRESLKTNGIETRPLFYPAHTMPAFKSEMLFPVAESLSKRGMNLPSYPELSRSDIIFICSEIKKVLMP
jgi:perosamine synthetase